MKNGKPSNLFPLLKPISSGEKPDKLKPVIILSDREKGIYNAAREQLPHNQHCYCVKHIEKNMKTRFKINFYEAAKTMAESVFNDTLHVDDIATSF
jgi:MULE transposase domain